VQTFSACVLALSLAAAPSSAETAGPQSSPPPPVVVPPPPPAPVEVDPRNYRMVLAGDILIGLSGAGMITMAVGLGIRSDAVTQRQAQTVADQPDLDEIERQARRIETGAQLAITGGVATAVLLSTGISLVAVGYRRERLRRMSLPSASIGPHGASLSWTLRF
jgi:hypothetical protein